MKISSFAKKVAMVLIASQIAACVPFSMGKEFTKFANGEKELPDSMIKRNLSGIITTDETAPDNYPRPFRGSIYMHGVEEGMPEYRMRIVRVSFAWDESFLWVSPGDKNYITFAFVPDHIPKLEKGDLVEVRHPKTWDVLAGLAKKEDYSMVIRVICRKKDPLHEACLQRAPKTGSNIGRGETKTPYPSLPQDYGFKQSEWYDQKGKPTKAYPDY